MGKIESKVKAGVVGHPASEKGEQGGSPSRRNRERILNEIEGKTELACHSEWRVEGRIETQGYRETVLVNPVVSAGQARYSETEWLAQNVSLR